MAVEFPSTDTFVAAEVAFDVLLRPGPSLGRAGHRGRWQHLDAVVDHSQVVPFAVAAHAS